MVEIEHKINKTSLGNMTTYQILPMEKWSEDDINPTKQMVFIYIIKVEDKWQGHKIEGTGDLYSGAYNVPTPTGFENTRMIFEKKTREEAEAEVEPYLTSLAI